MLGLLAFTSCANTYSITGTTNVSTLDGQKLYLKVLKDTALKNLDSCDVVHGQFHFAGSVDSVRVGTILLDENNGKRHWHTAQRQAHKVQTEVHAADEPKCRARACP